MGKSATDGQIQSFADSRVRVHAAVARQLVAILDDDRAVIDDVYSALNVQSPTWTDSRADGTPHLLTAADVLAYNGFAEDVRVFIKAHPAWGIVQKACINPIV